MADIRSIEAGKYNSLLAHELKKSGEFPAPEWVLFVKTSAHKVRPTVEQDFWHKRAASILRQIYLRGTVGVERLRSRYGGRKNRGSQPSRFTPGGGKIIRTILKQADAAGLTEKSQGKKAGRMLTAKGKAFMEQLAK